MKTILIPVDFSQTSSNALKYAVDLIKDLTVDRIILLKTFYKTIYEQVLPSADFIQISDQDIQNERNEIENKLKILSDDLRRNCLSNVVIQTEVSVLPLLRSVVEIIERENPDLLLLGSERRSEAEESHVARQVIALGKVSSIPVLVVPAEVRYKKISRSLIPCDFKNANRLTLIAKTNTPLGWIHPELLILNIDPKQKHLSREQQDLDALEDFLQGFKFSIAYSEDSNVVSGILNYADEKDVQLITALPGKYSFFANLTHKSTTQALALNAKHPVLILK